MYAGIEKAEWWVLIENLSNLQAGAEQPFLT